MFLSAAILRQTVGLRLGPLVVKKNFRASLNKHTHDCGANASRASRHNRHFVFQRQYYAFVRHGSTIRKENGSYQAATLASSNWMQLPQKIQTTAASVRRDQA